MKIVKILVLILLTTKLFAQNFSPDSTSTTESDTSKPAISIFYISTDTTVENSNAISPDTTFENSNIENVETPSVDENIYTPDTTNSYNYTPEYSQTDTTQQNIPEYTPTETPVTIEETTPVDYSSYTETPNTDTTETLNDTPLNRPVLGYGYGLFTYFGDVNDSYRKNPVVGRIGKNLILSRNVNNYLELKFNIIHGYLTGNERKPDRNLNFQTEILCGGINAEYNFYHLLKDKKFPIKPFVSLGLEYFEFNSKGDLYDAYGNYYYDWSDGSLRNIPEDSPNAQSSIILTRDYVYETDLRELNLDGLGLYQQVAIGLPIDIGFDFPVNKWVTLRFGNAFHYTFSDLIDNVNSKGDGIRQGTKGSDKFMYTYVTFKINLFGSSSDKEDDRYKDVDFAALNGDEDGDGILDFDDMCAGTPAGVTVNEKGCPADDDGDGIPNYLDQEPGTSSGAFYVDANGVGHSQEEYDNTIVSDTIAVTTENIYDYYPDLKKKVKQFTSVFLEIPKKFKAFDANKDEFISPDELSRAIDMFFDFESTLTIDDIYELNDFFFNQEVEEEEW